jgi:deoxyribodipyrimidine photolyase-related protein
VESLEKGSRRPYHKKKLALLLSNEPHFALEQAARAVKVIYIFAPGAFGDGLLDAQKKHALKQITVTRPAERELRLDLNQARRQGLQLEEVEDETWLTTEAQFDTIYPSPQTFLMDRFYRAMRKHTGLLMEAGKPIGGKFSHNHENRKPFRGEVRVTTEILCLVELYWSFRERKSDQLSGNQRLAMPMPRCARSCPRSARRCASGPE